jgi:adenosylcobinamide amidohydrolase
MKAIMPDAVLGKVPLALDFDYVRQAEIVRHRVADAEYKSLVVCFKKPTDVISTFEGPLSEISAVGNTYVPMHASLGHMAFGVEPAQAAVRKNLGLSEGQFAALMTGAHMDNLAVGEARWKNLKAVALVTAGVKGNAMRMSRDTGSYYSHGTINIIILTNHHLSAAAMARAIVTVTEAKSAALLDMDIRSTYLPLDYKATGTGTDNIIVVQGEGPDIPLGGGHTKIGELIAKAVHAGVTEAICKQNGIKPDRSVFQRLADRHLSLAQVVDRYPVTVDKRALTEKLAGVLQKAEYAALLESALAISDEYQKGLITNLGFFDELCCLTAAKLSGRTKVTLAEIPVAGTLPIVVDRAFGAVIAGITLQK